MRVRIRLVRRNACARASRAGLRPTRPHCAQEGEHLRFSPSCESTPFPSGRAARVKALSRKTTATHFPKQHEGARCHPVGARSARLSRPLCSDRREGRCCLVGRDDSARHPCVFAPSGERACARSFVAALLRMTKKRLQYFVILSGTKCNEGSRACARRPTPPAPPILPPLKGEPGWRPPLRDRKNPAALQGGHHRS